MIARLVTVLLALTGAGTMGQAPEFAQQYRQALGGAVAELQLVVEDFDDASARSGLSREEALQQYQTTDNEFLSERGTQISQTINRFERLRDQANALEAAGPFERIWLVVQSPDARVLNGARTTFEPAVPLTVAGLGMALLGAFVGWGIARGTGTIVKASANMMRRRNKGRKTQV
ncbi:MAG: DUF2937 family protein [Pseudomonadota bacterium]